MDKLLLIRGAKQLLTLQGARGPRRGADLRELGIISDGAVLVGDGLIQEVGSSRRLEALAIARRAEEISARGQIVLPGFVDSHTHLVSGFARLWDAVHGRTDPVSASRLIQETSRHTLQAQCLPILEDFIRHGTTTVEAKSGSAGTARGEMKILATHASLNARSSMLVSTFMGARSVASLEDPERYLQWICSSVLPAVRRRRLAEFVDISCENSTFTPELASRLFSTATQLGFALKMHTGQYSNTRGVQVAVQFGAASVDHLVYADEKDAAALAEADTIATLLPGPVFFNGTDPYAPARMLVSRGVAVALASGYNAQTCPSQSMQTVIALACLHMGMTGAEAITAATINGAHALRRAHEIGSIEKGKVADILLLGVSDYREIPYHFGVNLVNTAMKRGNVMVQRAKVTWPAA